MRNGCSEGAWNAFWRRPKLVRNLDLRMEGGRVENKSQMAKRTVPSHIEILRLRFCVIHNVPTLSSLAWWYTCVSKLSISLTCLTRFKTILCGRRDCSRFAVAFAAFHFCFLGIPSANHSYFGRTSSRASKRNRRQRLVGASLVLGQSQKMGTFFFYFIALKLMINVFVTSMSVCI